MVRGRFLLLTAVAVAALCGCAEGPTAAPAGSSEPSPAVSGTSKASVPPSSVTDSHASYAGLADELAAALQAKIPSVGWKADEPTSILRQPDGRCMLFLPQRRSENGLVAASDRFRNVMEAVNPVLGKHGFGQVSGLDKAAEGYWSLTSLNGQGAEVNVGGRSDVAIRVSVPVVSERCSAEEIKGLG